MIGKAEYFKPHMCPICGQWEFPTHGSYEVCENCGWEDDGLQENDPTSGGANWEGLEGYRALYQAGLHKLPDEDKRVWLIERGFFRKNGD